jgi:hypothetical protein
MLECLLKKLLRLRCFAVLFQTIQQFLAGWCQNQFVSETSRPRIVAGGHAQRVFNNQSTFARACSVVQTHAELGVDGEPLPELEELGAGLRLRFLLLCCARLVLLVRARVRNGPEVDDAMEARVVEEAPAVEVAEDAHVVGAVRKQRVPLTTLLAHAFESYKMFANYRQTSMGFVVFVGYGFKGTDATHEIAAQLEHYNKFFPARDKANTVMIFGRHNSAALVDTEQGLHGKKTKQGQLQAPYQAHAQLHGESTQDVQTEEDQEVIKQVVQQFVRAMDEHSTNNVLYGTKETDIIAFMFPHAGFVDVLCQLGFNRNDGIINLMPIVTYSTDE